METNLNFILWFICGEAILSAIQLLLRKKAKSLKARIPLIVVKFLLSIIFAVLVMAGPLVFRPLQPLMTVMYIALLADSAADAVYTLVTGLSKKNRSFGVSKALSAVFGIAYLVFGMINAGNIKAVVHTIETDKISGDYTIAFVTDQHYSCVHSAENLKKANDIIDSYNPDVILLGGDMVDDYTTKEHWKNC